MDQKNQTQTTSAADSPVTRAPSELNQIPPICGVAPTQLIVSPPSSPPDLDAAPPSTTVSLRAGKSSSSARQPKRSPVQKTPKAVEVGSDANTNRGGHLFGLSVRSAHFVDLYLLNSNGTRAYLEAGFQAKRASVARAAAARLLASVSVREYLAARIKAMFDSLGEQQTVLMRSLYYTAFADPRELSEHYRGACRFCHGRFNRWQYTAGEWDGIITKYIDKHERALERGLSPPSEPDAKGGTGYNPNADPNPNCPECGGEGRGRTIIKDTRHLSPAGVALFAGVEETKDGIEVKMHDQIKAREMLAKIAKLFDDATTVKRDFDAQELTAKYAAGMAQASARMALMREERRKLREGRGTPKD
jgi:phage terminase small subunit